MHTWAACFAARNLCPVGLVTHVATLPTLIVCCFSPRNLYFAVFFLALAILSLVKGCGITFFQYSVCGCRQLSAGLLINWEVQRDRLQAAPSYFITFQSLRAVSGEPPAPAPAPARALASQGLGRIYSYCYCRFILLYLHVRRPLDCTFI